MTREQRQHIKNLQAIFPKAQRVTMTDLWHRLQQLERNGSRLAEACCDGGLTDNEVAEAERAILDGADELLGFRAVGVPVFLNLDPRGHALKISDGATRKLFDADKRIHTDFGGYGIIAPDLT